MISNFFGNLPTPVKGGIAVTVGILLLSIGFFFEGNKRVLLIVFIGIAVVALSLFIFFLIWGWIKRLKGKAGIEKLKKLFSRSPRISADKQSKLDHLKDQFLSGIQKFKDAGMDLYSFPWYIIVGEPGSGKTEAIRHCNIGFPPGLQDPFQGTGGTINMDWWFTNEAIIIDTAGRMIFEEVDAHSEWITILKYLNRFRPNEPINGVFLVISAESLIRDSADEIKLKAGKISQRLHEIQKNLDLRFPVYVLITKSDLICGFREFFGDVNDPRIQNQIFGWSNSGSLDDLFDPDDVDKHLNSLVKRVKKWRFGLLKSDLDDEGRAKVSALYAFPNQLSELAPRLKLYLEQIFPSGRQLKSTWGKPLFVRGIYFTSSMQEGLVLDKAVAELLGQEIGSVGQGLSTRRKEISFFLHDLFKAKAFKEDGLVTRATNVRKQHQVRRLAVMTVGIIAILILLFQSWHAGNVLKKSVGRQHDFWVKAAHKSNLSPIGNKSHWRPIVTAKFQGGDYYYDDFEPINLAGETYNTIEFLKKLSSQSDVTIDIPRIYRLTHPKKDFREEMKKALKVLYHSSVLGPVIKGAQENLSKERNGSQWSDAKGDALGELIKLETYALPRKKGEKEKPLNLEVLFQSLLPDEQFALYQAEKPLFKELFDTINNWHPWEPEPLALGALSENVTLRKGLDAFIQYCFSRDSVNQSMAQVERFDKLYEDVKGVSKNRATNDVFSGFNESLVAVKQYEKDSIIGAFKGKLAKIRELKEADDANWRSAFTKISADLETLNHDVSEWTQTMDEINERSHNINQKIKEMTKKEGNLPLIDLYKESVKHAQNQIKTCFGSLLLPKVETGYKDPEKVEQNKFVDDLQTSLNESLAQFGQSKLNSERVEEFKNIEANFNALNNQFQLIKDDLAWLNERFELYKQADEEFTAEDTIPKLCELLPSIESLKSDLAGISAELKQNSNDPMSSEGIQVAREVLDLSARVRVSNMINKFLSNIPAGSTDYIKESVKDLVANKKIENLELHEKIPFGRFQPEFHPEPASVVMNCWQSLSDFIQDADNKLMARKTIVDRYNDLQHDVEKYLNQYTKYWFETAPLTFKTISQDLSLAQDYPSIPFVQGEGVLFSAEFHPDIALLTLNSVHKVMTEIGDNNLTEKLTNEWFENVNSYFDYWSTKAAAGLTIKQLPWSGFQTQLNQAVVWEVHGGIETFCKMVENAIKTVKFEVDKVFPEELKKRGIKTGDMVLAKIDRTREMMGNDAFRSACGDMVHAWSSLPQENKKARLNILKTLSSSTFSPKYLSVYVNDPKTFADNYWSQLSLRILQSLANAAYEDAVKAIDRLKEKCIFPLNQPNVAGRELSKPNIEEISILINGILHSASEDSERKEKELANTNFPKINTELERLAGKTLDPLMAKRLKAAQQIIEVVEAKEFSLVMAKVEDQAEENRGISIWRAVSIEDGEKHRTQQSTDKVIKKFEMPNLPLTIKFYKHPSDEKADRILSVNSIWAGIRLLHDHIPQNTPDRVMWKNMGHSEDRKEWTIAIILKDDAQKELTIWCRLIFKRSLPAMDDWPTWD